MTIPGGIPAGCALVRIDDLAELLERPGGADADLRRRLKAAEAQAQAEKDRANTLAKRWNEEFDWTERLKDRIQELEARIEELEALLRQTGEAGGASAEEPGEIIQDDEVDEWLTRLPKPAPVVSPVEEPIKVSQPQTNGPATSILIGLWQAQNAAAFASQGVQSAAKASMLSEDHTRALLDWIASRLGTTKSRLGRTPETSAAPLFEWLGLQADDGFVKIPVSHKEADSE